MLRKKAPPPPPTAPPPSAVSGRTGRVPPPRGAPPPGARRVGGRKQSQERKGSEDRGTKGSRTPLEQEHFNRYARENSQRERGGEGEAPGKVRNGDEGRGEGTRGSGEGTRGRRVRKSEEHLSRNKPRPQQRTRGQDDNSWSTAEEDDPLNEGREKDRSWDQGRSGHRAGDGGAGRSRQGQGRERARGDRGRGQGRNRGNDRHWSGEREAHEELRDPGTGGADWGRGGKLRARGSVTGHGSVGSSGSHDSDSESPDGDNRRDSWMGGREKEQRARKESSLDRTSGRGQQSTDYAGRKGHQHHGRPSRGSYRDTERLSPPYAPKRAGDCSPGQHHGSRSQSEGSPESRGFSTPEGAGSEHEEGSRFGPQGQEHSTEAGQPAYRGGGKSYGECILGPDTPDTNPASPSDGLGKPPVTPQHPQGERKPSKDVAVGKPIRGARPGEAIGLKPRVLAPSKIPFVVGQLRDFICEPLSDGPGTVVHCFIERNRSGTNTFCPIYTLYVDLEDGSGRLLLAARKIMKSKTSHYIISTNREDLFRSRGKRSNTSFLGKLRAAGTGDTEYVLYDGGVNPRTSHGPGEDSDSEGEVVRQDGAECATSNLRKELGVISFNFYKKHQKTGKRRMEVCVPKVKIDIAEDVPGETLKCTAELWQPTNARGSLAANFGRIRYQGAQNSLLADRLYVMHQRESRYDPLSSCLVDFKGRATVASVKNFQLIKSPPEDNVKRMRYYSEGEGREEQDGDESPRAVILQMGKVGKNCFNMDFEWPLSMLQAFGICLSRFDTNAQF